METLEEINQKHGMACAEAGSLEYRKLLLSEELAAKYALIKELNLKAHALVKIEAEKKKEEIQESTSTQDQESAGSH